jgi:hypothetical protein
MFTADMIRERVRQRPFVPLRLVTSAGETYDIYHPDLVMVGQRDLMIGTASAKHPDIYQQVTRVALLHVSELRDLPTPTQPASGNGTA